MRKMRPGVRQDVGRSVLEARALLLQNYFQRREFSIGTKRLELRIYLKRKRDVPVTQ